MPEVYRQQSLLRQRGQVTRLTLQRREKRPDSSALSSAHFFPSFFFLVCLGLRVFRRREECNYSLLKAMSASISEEGVTGEISATDVLNAELLEVSTASHLVLSPM